MHDNIDGLGPDYWADKLAQHGTPRASDRLGPSLVTLYEFMSNPAHYEDRAPRALLHIGLGSGQQLVFGVNQYAEALMLDGAPIVRDDWATIYATNILTGNPTTTVCRIFLPQIETVRVDLTNPLDPNTALVLRREAGRRRCSA